MYAGRWTVIAIEKKAGHQSRGTRNRKGKGKGYRGPRRWAPRTGFDTRELNDGGSRMRLCAGRMNEPFEAREGGSSLRKAVYV